MKTIKYCTRLNLLLVYSCVRKFPINLFSFISRIWFETFETNLIDESPGNSDTFLDVSNDSVCRLQAGVVVQCRPNLSANLLKEKLLLQSYVIMWRKAILAKVYFWRYIFKTGSGLILRMAEKTFGPLFY